MAPPLTEEQKKLDTDQIIKKSDFLLNTLLKNQNKSKTAYKESDKKIISMILGLPDEQEENLKQRLSSSIRELIRHMEELPPVDGNDEPIITELNKIISAGSSESYQDLWEKFEKINSGKWVGMFNKIKEELPHKLLRELHLSGTHICSLYSGETLIKVSKLKGLTAQHLDFIIKNNEHLSPEFCKTIINRLWSGGIIDSTIKDPILSNNDTGSISIENLQKIIVKAKLNADELKKIVPKLFSGEYFKDQKFTICKDSIVAHEEFNVDVANAIIIQINKLNTKTEQEDLIKTVLNKLLEKKDKDLPKLVTTLVTRIVPTLVTQIVPTSVTQIDRPKDLSYNDVKKSILNTIIDHENLTPQLAEILLINYANLIEPKQLERIINVMEDNPNIPRIIFRNPYTKKLITKLSDPQCIKLIEKAKTTENLETILTAINDGIEKRSHNLVDRLVSKLYEGTNPTGSFIIKTFQSIIDAFPLKTNRKQCREILQQQVMTNDTLLSKLSQETISGLLNMKPNPNVRAALTKFLLTAPLRISLIGGNPNTTTGNPSVETKTPATTEETRNTVKSDGKPTLPTTTTGVPLSAASAIPTLDTLAKGFTAKASDSEDLDPNALKVSGGKQLNYDKFIEQIGGRYTGTQSNNTFKIYKKDDTTQQNTLMEQRADGSLVFRKEFSEEDAKLFLESIKSLAETSAATPDNKLSLQMANFTEKQLECIRTLVAKPDINDATPYTDLLSKVEFISGKLTVDLLPKPPQASPHLVAKPQDAADLLTRPKSAPEQRERPKWNP